MKKPEDILRFIIQWRSKNDIADDVNLSDSQITDFVRDLQEEISKMDFSVKKGTTIIGYSGSSNGVAGWKVVESVVGNSNGNATYITSLPAGQLLGEEYRDRLEKYIFNHIIKDQNAISMITGGWSNGKRQGPNCGYGKYLSLDDFVSAKLMGETTGASKNIILFIPDKVDSQKVFATTEIEQIFKNNNFEYINGIPKNKLEVIYRTGETGKQSFFEIINKTAKQAVGDVNDIDLQATKLRKAFSENGILNQNSSDFSIVACYDANGDFIGVELTSSNAETIIEKPKNTAYSQDIVDTIDKNVTNSSDGSWSSRKDNNTDVNQKDGAENSSKEYDSKRDDGNLEEKSSKENYSDLKENVEESGNYNNKSETIDDSDAIKKEENSSETKTGINDKEVDNTQAEESRASDKGATSKEHVGDSDKKSKADNYTDSRKDTSSNTGKTETAKEEDTSKENTKSETTGDYASKENGADDSGTNKETMGNGKDVLDDKNGSKKQDVDIDKNDIATSKNDDLLSEKSKKFIKDVEDATESKIDTNFSSKTVRKINKALDIMDKVGDIMDLVDAAKTIWSAGKLFKSGNEDEAGKVLRDYGFSTLGGMVFSVPLGVLAGAAAINPLLTLILVGIAGYYGSQMGEFISDLLGEILGLYDEAGAYTYPVDPLIFDLNGDGVKTVTLADGVHFDFDKNGFAEKIGWVSAEDGLLVRDLDKNGKIDSGRELMGDLTELSDDLLAANGFEALSYFDANADGVIDAKDDIYNELQIWQDKNQNGVVDAGEIMSLSEAGIASINLAYENIDVTDESGNGHSQRGTYTKTDGTTSTVEDVWFEKDAANTVVSDTIDKNVLEETDEIAGLPDIQGKGNQYSLHQAMLRDKTGTLKKLVEDYIAETDSAARKAMLPELIYVWTGVNDVEVTSRGSGISDARKLAALEVITGRKFNSAYGSNPVQQAGVYLEEAFTKLVELYYGQLEMQTTYAQEYAELYMNIDFDENGKVIYDISSIAERYMAEYDKNPLEGRKQIFGFVDSLRKTGMDSLIGKEVVYGKFAITNSDLYHVIDYQGDDVITGSNADDILIGEIGNDILRGEGGNDTYIFNLGDGEDTIVEGGGTDRIVFGEGIAAEDIFVSREDRDLYLTNRTSGDRIRVKDFFYDAYYFVESVEFADGTKWSIDDLQDKARYYYGTDGDDEIRAANSYYYAASREDNEVYAGAGNDTVYGNNGDDTLYGEEGNDILYGGNGNDVLNGGKGADILYGENGNDTYVFNLGDGEDTIVEGGGTDRIVFGEGIAAEDIFVSREDRDLYLTNRTSGDRIRVKDFFYDAYYFVESVEFADGTKWSIDDLQDKARYYYGTDGDDEIRAANSYYYAASREDNVVYAGAGNDTVYGNNGDDTLYGEEGNDILYGGNGNDVLNGGKGADILYGENGNDTYVFNLGDGEDTIVEGGGTDRIVFGEGIAAEDIFVSREDRDLYLTNRTSGDRIRVKDFFYDAYYFVDSVEFADGTKWSIDDLQDKARYYYGTDGDDEIRAANSYYYAASREDNVVYAGAGNDTVYGNNGDDTLYGEEGNDILYGGNGNDVLNGGKGADILYGENGNDTYVFNLGDGEDTIVEGGGTDRIVFGEGIAAEDIFVSREDRDLYLTNRTSGDRIRVKDFFYDAYYFVDSVEFADGTKWSIDDLQDKARYYYGTDGDDEIRAANSYYYAASREDNVVYAGAGNDTVYGNNGDDTLYGEEGNDILYGGNGNDVLNGGKGADILYGENGNDTYVFNLGDGEDTIVEGGGTDRIVFGEGIAAEDIFVSREDRDLYLTNRTSGDRIRVKDFFYDAYYFVESVEFADGTKWSIDDLQDKARYYYGTDGDDEIRAANSYYYAASREDNVVYAGAGNDTVYGNNGDDTLYGEEGDDILYGGNGNDVLNGGKGADILYGENGNDTYVFNLGDGEDTIVEGGGTDRIVFGEGILAEDIFVTRQAGDLYLTNRKSKDRIKVKDFFNDDWYKVESFHTSDGRTLDYSKINIMIQAMASFEDSTGMMWEDAVEQKNEQAQDLINQWWVKEAI